jgi:hypothetical protein
VSVLTAYQRFRFLWGAVDWEGGSGSPYTSGQTGATLGTSAAAGVGTAARRAILRFDRTGIEALLDDAEMHFDFLNYTAGTPDDSWITSDYTTLEGYLTTWWGTVKAKCTSAMTLKEIRWYRVGPGINPPNPAERVTSVAVAGTSGTNALPPQVASSITFRTAVRRSWGRTYLPGLTVTALNAGGDFTNAAVDDVANATSTLVHSAVAADFPLVVFSRHLSALLTVEAVECDDIPDIIRRRRFKHYLRRTIVNT